MVFWLFRGFSVLGGVVVVLVGSLLTSVPAAQSDDSVAEGVAVDIGTCRWEERSVMPGAYTNSGYCQMSDSPDITADCSRKISVLEEGPVFTTQPECKVLDPWNDEDKDGNCAIRNNSETVTCIMEDVHGVVVHCQYDSGDLVDCVDPHYVNAILPPGSGTSQCKFNVVEDWVDGPDGSPVRVYHTTAVCPDGYGHAFFFEKVHPYRDLGEWSSPSVRLPMGSNLAANNCSITLLGDAICEFAGLSYRFAVSEDRVLYGGVLIDSGNKVIPTDKASVVVGTNGSYDDMYWDDECNSGVIVADPEASSTAAHVDAGEAMDELATAFLSGAVSAGFMGNARALQPLSFAEICKDFLFETFAYVGDGIVSMYQRHNNLALSSFGGIADRNDVQISFINLIMSTEDRMTTDQGRARAMQWELQKVMALLFYTSIGNLGDTISASLTLMYGHVTSLVERVLDDATTNPINVQLLHSIAASINNLPVADFTTLYNAMGTYMNNNFEAMAMKFPFNRSVPN